jgi:HEAT repeat protein
MTGLLKDKSVRLEHYRLIHVLKSAIGEEATAAMLVPLLKDPDLEIRLAAAFDLTVHCPNARALRPAMLEALAGDDLTMREEAAFYFLSHDPGMSDRVLDLLADQTAKPGEGSYLAWDLVKRTREATPGLMKPFAARLAARLGARLGASTQPNGPLFVMAALGEIGPEAAASVPALLNLSAAKDLDIATRAVAALVKIDPQTAAAKVDSLLEWVAPDHESPIRLSAMASLRDLGHYAAEALPTLLKLADEKDLAISAGAIQAISKIEPSTGRALKEAIARGETTSNDE